jgi:hypothetical protein
MDRKTAEKLTEAALRQLVCAGKWGYGPWQSDRALDFAWDLEIRLLREALSKHRWSIQHEGDGCFEQIGVILAALAPFDNNSFDEARELFTQLRTSLLQGIDRWAARHSIPEESKSRYLQLLDRVGKRILYRSET